MDTMTRGTRDDDYFPVAGRSSYTVDIFYFGSGLLSFRIYLCVLPTCWPSTSTNTHYIPCLGAIVVSLHGGYVIAVLSVPITAVFQHQKVIPR